MQTHQTLDISSAASKNTVSHLWVLSDELSILSLFDDTVPFEVFKNIIEAVKTRAGTDYKTRKFIIDETKLNLTIQKILFVHFVSKHSFKALSD